MRTIFIAAVKFAIYLKRVESPFRANVESYYMPKTLALLLDNFHDGKRILKSAFTVLHANTSFIIFVSHWIFYIPLIY